MTVLARLSVGLGFTLRYDQSPPPRPIPSGTPADLSYERTFQPFSDKVDTLTEGSLILQVHLSRTPRPGSPGPPGASS